MQPRKPRARRRIPPKRGSRVQSKKNLTLRMLEELRQTGAYSSSPGVENSADAITLRGIWERLVVKGLPWTPADYMNVGRIHKKYERTR